MVKIRTTVSHDQYYLVWSDKTWPNGNGLIAATLAVVKQLIKRQISYTTFQKWQAQYNTDLLLGYAVTKKQVMRE